MHLASVLSDVPQPHRPLLLLQSSLAQSSLPLLRHLLDNCTKSEKNGIHTLLFCFLYAPSNLCDGSSSNLTVVDLTHCIPGYDASHSVLRQEILNSLEKAPNCSLNVVFDSVDTLLSDQGSVAEVSRLLAEILQKIRSNKDPSRLILHILAPCPLIPHLTHLSFSPSLTHLTARPTSLLTHLSTTYSTPPPPLSPPQKFWAVYLPLSQRLYESDQLVYGAKGEGASSRDDFVVDVLVRGGAAVSGRRNAVEQAIEGFSSPAGGPCKLIDLRGLSGLNTKQPVVEANPDPTRNLPFKLDLTQTQQDSRAQVPLPYAHKGKSFDAQNTHSSTGAIYYNPDSGDDLDDDDPDDDLDI